MGLFVAPVHHDGHDVIYVFGEEAVGPRGVVFADVYQDLHGENARRHLWQGTVGGFDHEVHLFG